MYLSTHKAGWKRICILCSIVLLGLLVFEISISAAEMENGAEHSVCDEGNVLLFPVDEYEVAIIDSNGSERCRFDMYTQIYGGASRVKENAVLDGYVDNFYRIYSVADAREIDSVPDDDKYAYFIAPGFYCIMDKSTGLVGIYDNHGALVSTVAADLSMDMDWIGHQVLELSDGWLVFIGGESGKTAFFLDDDLNFKSYLTNSLLLQALSDYRLKAFGNYIAATEDNDNFRIFTKEGIPVMNRMIRFVPRNSDFSNYMEHYYSPLEHFAILDTGEKEILIDEMLKDAGPVPKSKIPCFYGLNELRNDGGEDLFVPEDESLCGAGDVYYVTKKADPLRYILRVRSEKSFAVESDRCPYVSLVGAAVPAEDPDNVSYCSDYRLFDNSGHEAGFIENTSVYGATGDCWIASREIYRGIMDFSGKWIWKIIDEEI